MSLSLGSARLVERIHRSCLCMEVGEIAAGESYSDETTWPCYDAAMPLASTPECNHPDCHSPCHEIARAAAVHLAELESKAKPRRRK